MKLYQAIIRHIFGNTSNIDITDDGVNVTADLTDTTVTPGSYTNSSLTVDQKGRLTAASSGIAVTPVDVAIFRDVQIDGVEGGTFTSGALRTRVLNTQVGGGSIASLATNTITILESGDYLVLAAAPAYKVDRHKCYIDHDGTIHKGQNTQAASADNSVTSSIFYRTLTLAVNDTLILKHECQTTKATDGLGRACSFGIEEIYAEVVLLKF